MSYRPHLISFRPNKHFASQYMVKVKKLAMSDRQLQAQFLEILSLLYCNLFCFQQSIKNLTAYSKNGLIYHSKSISSKSSEKTFDIASNSSSSSTIS